MSILVCNLNAFMFKLNVRKNLIIATVLATALLVPTSANAATPKSGAKCTKVGATANSAGKKFTCIKSGSKLVWNKGVKSASVSISKLNAARTAVSYLSLTAFSREGLIKQLEFEGFSKEDATYGTDAAKADWNEQAAKAAKAYLKLTSFSRSGLIEQLVFEGYTQEQAESGVNTTGL
jgi:hypothetical protein